MRPHEVITSRERERERERKNFVYLHFGKNLGKNVHEQGKNPYMAASTAERGGLRNPQNRDHCQN